MLVFISISSCVLLLAALVTIISLSRELNEQKRAVQVLIESMNERMKNESRRS